MFRWAYECHQFGQLLFCSGNSSQENQLGWGIVVLAICHPYANEIIVQLCLLKCSPEINSWQIGQDFSQYGSLIRCEPQIIIFFKYLYVHNMLL